MKLTGIIDIGSNSMRLSIIKQLDSGGHYVLDEHKSSPRLSNLISDTGELSPKGTEELMTHLREFQGLCAAHGVNEILAVGTAALRTAKNGPDIVRAVKDAVGIEVDIISGDEEAQLGYSAIMNTLLVDTAYLIDIGGGSTEISLVERGRLIASYSFPFGAVTMSREWSENVTPGLPLELPEKARLAAHSQPFLDIHKGVPVIGIGGTIRSIARVHQAHMGYPLAQTHNYAMPVMAVEETIHMLASLPLTRRKKLDGLSKERADLIVPGGAILLALMRKVQAPLLRVSGRGLRDGIFYTRVLGMTKGPQPLVLENSVANLLRRYEATEKHANHVTKLAQCMLPALVESSIVPKGSERTLFAAAMLHRIGVNVSYYNYDKHTFYLIIHSAIYGLSHREVVITGLAAAFRSKGKHCKMAAQYRTILSEDDIELAARLGMIVRMAEALDRRHEQRVEGIQVNVDKDLFKVRLPATADVEVEISTALTLSANVKKIFARKLVIEKEGISTLTYGS